MTMTQTRQVLPATPEDRDRCTATAVAAFVNDPLMRWMFPDAEQYLAAFPQVARHYGGTAFDLGTAFRTDDFAGVAVLARTRRVRRRGSARRRHGGRPRTRTPRRDLRVHGAGRRVAPRSRPLAPARPSASIRPGKAPESARSCSRTPWARSTATAASPTSSRRTR